MKLERQLMCGDDGQHDSKLDLCLERALNPFERFHFG